MVFGVHPVKEMLQARKLELIYLLEGDKSPALHQLYTGARDRGVAVEFRNRAELDRIAAGGVHQGAIAIGGEFQFRDLADILQLAEQQRVAPLIVVLDGVQDPHNLGAICRTAEALGAHGVVVGKDRAATVTAAAVKASAGATEHVAIAQVVNIVRALEELKQAGVWIFGAAVENGQAPWQVDFTIPTAIVLGAEGAGIRPLVLKQCDFRVRIPLAGKVASLNVSAAGAMLLHEAIRQRS